MTIELRYFTGTGNSLKILNTIKDSFCEAKNIVNISTIKLSEEISDCDLLGFCFPVYAFGIPRIAGNYLKLLRPFKNRQKTFVIITAGDLDESGFAIRECNNILIRKNCEIIYSQVVQMPINWVTSMNPPDKEEALEIINNGISQIKPVAQDILNGVIKHHTFNIPKRYGRLGLYKEYWLFKYLGIKNLWRLFSVYDSCNGCQLCARACPTNSIEIINKKPVWKPSCEQCMRCVNLCPNESVYQKYSGSTIGRNKYIEPDFRPIHDDKVR